MVWDGADKLLFTPLTNAFWLPVEEREAIDVTALDRGARLVVVHEPAAHPAEAARGFCGEPVDTLGPGRFKSGKPNGVNPGFIFKTADGRRFVLKTGRRRSARAPDGCRLHRREDLLRRRVPRGLHEGRLFPSVHPADRSGGHQRRGREEVPFRQRHIAAVVRVAARGPGGRCGASSASSSPDARSPLHVPRHARRRSERRGRPSAPPRAPRELPPRRADRPLRLPRAEHSRHLAGGRSPARLHRAPHAGLGRLVRQSLRTRVRSRGSSATRTTSTPRRCSRTS